MTSESRYRDSEPHTVAGAKFSKSKSIKKLLPDSDPSKRAETVMNIYNREVGILSYPHPPTQENKLYTCAHSKSMIVSPYHLAFFMIYIRAIAIGLS